MKTALLLILCATPGFAQNFGDDNPTGQWLPVPDGFKWPATPKEVKEFHSEEVRLSDLPAKLRKGLAGHWPGRIEPGNEELSPSLPERVRLAQVDLNQDRQPEIFLHLPLNSGTGGPYYQVLTPTPDGFRIIGGFQGQVRFVESKNDWLQIEGMSRGGGGNYTRYLMTFEKTEYRMTRKEHHDFNVLKVTVGAP